MEKLITQYVKMIDLGLFAAAHEVFEDSWRVETDSDKKIVLKGLINGAAALEIKRRAKGDPKKPLEAFLRGMVCCKQTGQDDLFTAFEATEKALRRVGAI